MTPTPRCGTPPPGNGKDAGDDAKPKEKHRSAYDGKLYVEAYLKQQNQLADDDPQAIAQSVISGNVFFNGPRAGINANDGFGGGDEISHNLVFSTCRESGDHGPFNR